MSGTATPKPCRVEWPPLDGDIIGAFLQRDAGGSRTHGMRFCRPPPRHVTSASCIVALLYAMLSMGDWTQLEALGSLARSVL